MPKRVRTSPNAPRPICWSTVYASSRALTGITPDTITDAKLCGHCLASSRDDAPQPSLSLSWSKLLLILKIRSGNSALETMSTMVVYLSIALAHLPCCLNAAQCVAAAPEAAHCVLQELVRERHGRAKGREAAALSVHSELVIITRYTQIASHIRQSIGYTRRSNAMAVLTVPCTSLL